jgi:hypothetical protein
MGKLKNEIAELIEQAYSRGVDGAKIAKRLVEAGLVEMIVEEQGTDGFAETVAAWGGSVPFIGNLTAKNVTVHFGHPPVASAYPLTQAIQFAGEMFDGYARHHLAKEPADIEKAQRNIDAAVRMFEAIEEPYTPPETPSDAHAAAMTDWKQSILADSSPVEHDSGLGASGSAKKLLADLHIAEIGGDPVLGVRVHLEDQPVMATMVELGFLNRDDVSDRVTVTTKGKDAIGVRPDGVPDVPVEVASVTGNIEERELAGRYIEAKIKGVEKWVAENPADSSRHDYEIMARVLMEIAYEFRIGLHIPSQMIDGRVIPYNEDRSTGVTHAIGLQSFFDDVYTRNVKAGWWTNIETGEPKKRNVGELFMLMVTELCEAYDAWLLGSEDDKLPQYPGIGVEIGDLLIRVGDFCGALAAGVIPGGDPAHNPGDLMFRRICDIAREYEAIRKTPAAVGDPETAEPIAALMIGEMVDAKLAFNATRADHKIENRLKEDGKKT